MVAILFGLGSLDFLFEGPAISPALCNEFFEGDGMPSHLFDFPDGIPHIGRIVVGGYLRERLVWQIVAKMGKFHHIEREFFIYY